MDRFGQAGWYSIAAQFLHADDRPPPVSVLVVDDHFLFAEMLTLALQIEDRLEIVGHARNGEQAIELAAWLRPDVVLMDIQMPLLDGIEATPRVLAAAPGSKVVVVSSSNEPEDKRRAEAAGAVGYLSKESSTEDLLRAIEHVVSTVIPLRPGLRAVPPADQTALY